MTAYQRGKTREYQTRDLLTAKGWQLVAQTGGSHGPADLVMVHPIHGLALIQVGSKTKTLGPNARKKLCDLADLCGALAILTIWTPYKGPRYWQITNSTPHTWPEWSP